MMFHPLAEQTVLSLKLGGVVCEFGNQRYGGERGHASVKEFYLANGFTEYRALDVNTDKDAIIADLNEPVDIGWQFDLVTNNGTSEHLFDQRRVFENAHNLCVQGGTMLHILPYTPWINHGFFNYNPIVFRDLAAANGYTMTLARIANRWGNGVTLDADWAYIEKRPEQLQRATLEVLNYGRGEPFVVFAFVKETDAPFRVPHQGKYLKDIESEALRERYAVRT